MLAAIYGKIGLSGAGLIIVAVAGVYFIVKNAVYIWMVGKDFHEITALIAEKPSERDSIIEDNLANPLIGIINDIVKTHAGHSDDIKSEAAFLFNHYLRKPLRDITLVRVVGGVSPLLGLLGTILGLMGVFGELAVSSAAATSTILAAGIWEAVYTTVMGLCIAIPALIAYHILSIYIRSFHLEVIEYSYRFLGNSHYCMSNCRKPRNRKYKKAKAVSNEL